MRKQEKNTQDQLTAHTNEVKGIIELVKTCQWDKESALLAIEKSQLFWMSYIGGSPETNQMADNLWSAVVEGLKLCTPIEKQTF